MPRIAFSLLLALAALLAAAPAGAAVQASFECRIAEGPRLTACRPVKGNLPPATIDILRRSVEAAPACQLSEFTPGQTVVEIASFEGTAAQLDERVLAEPRYRPPDWLRKPTPDLVARFYPEAAMRDEVAGRAVLSCEIDARGDVVGCRAIEETPQGYDFGTAAVHMATAFRFRPAMRGCEALDGERVRIPINFLLPPEPPPAWSPQISARDGLISGLALAGLLLAGAGLWLARRGPAAAMVPSSIIEPETRRWPWLLAAGGVVLTALSLWSLAPSLRSAAAAVAARGLDMGVIVFIGVILWLLPILPVSLVQTRLLVMKDKPEWRGRTPAWAASSKPFRAAIGIWRLDPALMTDPWLKRLVPLARAGVLIWLIATPALFVFIALVA